MVASTILFAFAVIAYTSFYYSYVPIRGISVPVYLQFDHGSTPNVFLDADPRSAFAQGGKKWPHAVAGVQGLVTRQKYDVSVEMTVPRSRRNLRAGNWMLDLSLRSHSSSVLASLLGWDDEEEKEQLVATPDGGATTPPPMAASKPTTLAHSRRPALLTYRSWPTEHIHRLLRLPFYLTGFGSESETLHIRMLEAASFAEAPTSLRLELRSTVPLEVYSTKVHIRAKLEGLRWLMYRHRLLSAGVFVLLFWGTEMGLLLLTWGAASLVLGSSSSSPSSSSDGEKDSADRKHAIKGEAPTEPGTPASDTSHTFPTLSSHPPLRYSSPSSPTKLKPEPPEPRLEDIPLKEEAEADDEEDDFVLESPPLLRVGSAADVGFTDSGLGTGVDSERERERERVKRRGSGRGKEER